MCSAYKKKFKLQTCKAELCMKLSLLINIKMPTIVGQSYERKNNARIRGSASTSVWMQRHDMIYFILFYLFYLFIFFFIFFFGRFVPTGV